jgi:hypothetical protein
VTSKGIFNSFQVLVKIMSESIIEAAYLKFGDEVNWNTQNSIETVRELRESNTDDILFFKSTIEITNVLSDAVHASLLRNDFTDVLVGVRLMSTLSTPVNLQMSIGGQRVCTLPFSHLGRVCHPLYDRTILPLYSLDKHSVHWQTDKPVTVDFIFASLDDTTQKAFGMDLYMADAQWWHDPTQDLSRVYIEDGQCKTHTPAGHELQHLTPYTREMRRRHRI